ncbi:MAG: glycerophosphodiester phosphodiesterase [Anaerolineaceae bacterium]|nr:glycerophosphodiester phosphodiesterase [Anaerolineaceae bacterium]
MTQFFGHRGYSGKYPENTMLAFQKAIEAGADGIELDVQFSKDEELVIIHDETLDRTTTGTGWVKDHTLQELRSLDASFKFTGKYGVNVIPTLDEVLAFMSDKDAQTNIELKTGVFEYEGIEEAVLKCVRKHNVSEKVIISSFNHYSILKMRKLAPDLKCGLLTDCWLINAGKYVHDLDVPCYHPAFRNLTPEITAEIKQYGLQINTWTVNTLEDFKHLEGLGIDIAIGNFPGFDLND